MCDKSLYSAGEEEYEDEYEDEYGFQIHKFGLWDYGSEGSGMMHGDTHERCGLDCCPSCIHDHECGFDPCA